MSPMCTRVVYPQLGRESPEGSFRYVFIYLRVIYTLAISPTHDVHAENEAG